MIGRSSITGSLFATLWELSAWAQSHDLGRQPGPSSSDPKACAPGERLEQGPRGPERPATNGKAEDATDKLARTEGVICPPDVDPKMNLPTPEGGRTPVVPPPGSPGGDPNLRPK